MKANIKEHMQEMTARMETNQVKLETDRNTNQKQIKQETTADQEEREAN
jgi:hypothetical protein